MTRVERLIETKGVKAGESVIVSRPSNIFYLSGYTGEGFVLVSPNTQVIITDFRYTEQAGQEAPDFKVFSIEGAVSHLQKAYEVCKQEGVQTVYYEDDECTVCAYKKAVDIFKDMELTPLGNDIEKLRMIKDAEEIRRIEFACKISSETFERILPQIKVGLSEKKLALMLSYDMLEHGAEKMGFDVITAAGANGSKPHAVPTDYRIRKGDMITMDFGAKYRGYTADMTRTIAMGTPSDEMRKVYGIVLKAQEMAQDAIKANKDCAVIDAIARDYIYAQGYKGCFGHGLGHSLGIDVHEEPRLNALSKDVLRENQLMTIEPGIYLPGIGGVRIENTVVVETFGCRSLISSTRELIIL